MTGKPLVHSASQGYSGYNAELKSTEGLGIVGTIYEGYEESYHSSIEDCRSSLTFIDNTTSSGDDKSSTSTSSSDSSSIICNLQRTVRAWSEATGLPATVTVNVEDRIFKLHKFPLVSQSGYLKRQLMETNDIQLPSEWPGGTACFEAVASFCYGSKISLHPGNIAVFRCAAEFLEMTEEFSRGNLSKRCDLYLKQVVLQKWDDVLLVLKNCQSLFPLAENLIVSSCIEALAATVCRENLNLKNTPSKAEILSPGQCLKGHTSGENCKSWDHPNFWMNDLLEIPVYNFCQIVASIRQKGLAEKHIGRAMMRYIDRWIFSRFQVDGDGVVSRKVVDNGALTLSWRTDLSINLEAIIGLLPREKNVVPVSFLFALLRCVIACDASRECKVQLETRIAVQLPQATLSDFILPSKLDREKLGSRLEVESMQQIVSLFVSQQVTRLNEPCRSLNPNEKSCLCSACCRQDLTVVAKVWDEYLAELALDSALTPRNFSDLAGAVPSSFRSTHDDLYRAIHVYLTAHPHISEQERLTVCKILNCQKLSQEMCIHAVQNEMMPLRMIVQAMFMHQLQTSTRSPRGVEMSEGFNQAKAEKLVRSVSCHKKQSTHSSRLQEVETLNDDLGRSLTYFLRRSDPTDLCATHFNVGFKTTNSRLRVLEEEMFFMKKSLQERQTGTESPVCVRSSSFKAESIRSEATTPGRSLDQSKSWKGFARLCLGQPRLAQKGCGGGVGQKLIRTLQKLGLGSLWLKSKEVDADGDDTQATSAWTEESTGWSCDSMKPVAGSTVEHNEGASYEHGVGRRVCSYHATTLDYSGAGDEETETHDKNLTVKVQHSRHHSLS